MDIEIRDLHFSYESGVQALAGVSLTTGRGETVALVGHNGSGKSTLVKHLNGLLRPDAGEVLIDGKPTADLRVAQIARRVALLFQNPDNQICKGTVWEETVFGPKNLGYPEEKIRDLASDSLAALGLTEMRDRNPHDLGFSERKRLAIASILAMNTEAVVLDEPTAGLDSGEIKLLEAVLRGLRDHGRTVLVISHDMDFVAENMTRAICLGQGRKQYDGGLPGLFGDPALLKRCGLVLPQTVQVGSRLGLSPDRLTPEAVAAGLSEKRPSPSGDHPATSP
ncbi:MAG: ABC transporter ATP-binding protein [Desulfovibrionaceae bacterium]|nr:ABC transporter ATP-binding protein [Desulfovibrionaceae bacterium]